MPKYVIETYRKQGGDWLTRGPSDRVFKKIAFLPSRKPDKTQSSVSFSSKKIMNNPARNVDRPAGGSHTLH